MSGLFGGGGGDKPKPPALNLFSATPTSSTAPTNTFPGLSSSPFGTSNSSAAQPQQSTATTTQGSVSNLFASLGSTPAASSAGTQQGQAAPSLSSLFGNKDGGATSGAGSGNTQQAQSNPFGSLSGGGGLFGKPQQSQPQQATLSGATLLGGGGSNPFGSMANSQGAQGLGQQQQQQSQSDQQLAQDAFHSAYFNSLLEKNKKRSRETEQGRSGAGLGSEMPGLQLGLGDISKRVRELGGMSAARGTGSPQRNGSGRAKDTQAHYLLAASGVNPGTTLRDLNSLSGSGGQNGTAGASLRATAFPTTGMSAADDWDPDSHKYVEQLQQQTTLAMISDGLARAHRNFDAYLQKHVDINMEEQRRRVYEHFGLASRTREADGGADSIGQSPDGILKGSFGRPSPRKGGRSVGQGSMGRSVFRESGLQKSVIGMPNVGGSDSRLFGETGEKTAAGASVLGATIGPEDRFLRERQALFAKKVQQLNEARLTEEDAWPILREFEATEMSPGSDSPIQLSEAYKAMIEIAEEDNPEKKLRARQYMEEYMDDTPNSSKSVAMRKRILDGSRRALEKQFYSHLTSLVARNPREANLGGVPTTINQVRAYVRIRASRKDLVPDGLELQTIGEDYCWALIFFLLRSGYSREAARYVADNKTAFQALDRNFITYITSYVSSAEGRLHVNLQSKIAQEYQQRMRMAPENSLDPYRMACYKVIGRCELSKRSLDSVGQGVEDWIWLQFALARESNRAEDAAAEVYGLDDVRDTVREIGQRHFSKPAAAASTAAGTGAGAGASDNNPSGYGTFFYLQILAGLFEPAIAYLYQHAYVSAVHFAIALSYYGLLRVSAFDPTSSAGSHEHNGNNGDALLTYTTRQLPQIAFGRMLGFYTRDFRAANAVAATDYLSLIHLNADLQPQSLGRSQAQLCHEALRELVLETREFAALLGDIRSDGTRIRGAIEARLRIIGIGDQEQFLRAVTLQAAAVADDCGRTTDAVLLYHLSEDYDAVISIINRALSDDLSVDLGGERARIAPVKSRLLDPTTRDPQQAEDAGSSFSLTAVDDPTVLARNFVALYNSNALFYRKIKPANRDACGLLLRMADVRNLLEAGRWAECLDLIAALGILPLDSKNTNNNNNPLNPSSGIGNNGSSNGSNAFGGNVSRIRAQATNIQSLPPTIGRLVGPLLVWAMVAIGREREVLSGGSSSNASGNGNEVVYESETRRAMSEELVAKAKDLMVFAGLVKLRLGKGVWEGVVSGAGEVGVF